MGRSQDILSDTISKELNLTVRTGRAFFKRLLELIREDIIFTGKADLRGLGSFTVIKRKPVNTTHPITGNPITIPEKKIVKFKTSKKIKILLNPEIKTAHPKEKLKPKTKKLLPARSLKSKSVRTGNTKPLPVR